MSAAARRRAVPIGMVAAGLAAAIEPLVQQLLPHGRRDGSEWRVGSPAGEAGTSMAVHLRPPKAGVWCDFGSGDSGDALDLVAAVLCRGDKRRALAWSLSWLGLGDGAAPAARPAIAAPARPEAAASDGNRGPALRLWLAAAALPGSPAAAYLAGRGIDLAALGRLPRALRCHPGLWNARSGRAWPALVAAITGGDGRGGAITAIHRTWLMVRPDGSVGKAPIVDPDGGSEAKMTLGTYRGGLIPLWRGASLRPLKEAVEGETLLLSEGIEDGLSAALARPDLRAAAAVSLANMGSIVLPPAITTVIIIGQNDPWWSTGGARLHAAQRGLERAIRHFQAEGRTVRLARPPAGKDVNDLLRGVA